MATRKMTLQEEVINNIREDRLFLLRLILSATKKLGTSEEHMVHKEYGEVLTKYLMASVKNTEQLIEVLKSKNRIKAASDAEEISDKEKEDIYSKIIKDE